MIYTRKFRIRVSAKTKEDLPLTIDIENILDSILHHYWKVIEITDTKEED